MVITRYDWRINGDLLSWIAAEFPGLTREEFEAAFRLLADPELSKAGEAAGGPDLAHRAVAVRSRG